jgi:transcriptional regulator with XRE-family HTH domain
MTRAVPSSLSIRLGTKITGLRLSRGMTQKQFEQAAGFHQGYSSRVESGLIQPNLDTLAVISRVFGLSISRLVAGIEDE